MTQQADKPNDIGGNFLLGHRKKIAKFLMRTFTCRSTFLYGADSPYTGTAAVFTSYLRVSVLDPGLEQWTKEQRNRSTDSLSVLEATGRTLNKVEWAENVVFVWCLM